MKGIMPAAALGVLLGGAWPLAGQEMRPAAAGSTQAKDQQSFNLTAYVDLYAAYNRNRPPDHVNFLPGANTMGSQDGELALGFAVVELQRDPAPVGFHLTLAAGDELKVLHAGESQASRDAFRHLYQASVSYLAPVGRGLRIEAGVYPSHIGFESALTRDNWSYTGSWLANFSPYYQTGVNASYSLSDHWNAGLHVINGWQVIGDNNAAKSLGAHVAWTVARGSVVVNGWAGPELPGDNHDQRTLWDLVATLKASDALDLAMEAYSGRQQLSAGRTAQWNAASAFARYRWSPVWATAARLERFEDPDLGGITGTPQTLEEATWTLEAHPHDGATLKLETRYDRSTARVFSADTKDGKAKDQLLFVLASIFTF